MKGGSQTQSTQVDPQTQAYVDQMRRAALGYAGVGAAPGSSGGMSPQQQAVLRGWGFSIPNQTSGGYQPIAPNLPPAVLQAQQNYGNYASAGNLGLSALTGNAAASQAFQNPYLAQMNPFFAQQRAQAVNAANDQATQAGAFGGDRSGIAAAIAGSQADQNQAGFNYQNFNDSMMRALQAANLGYGANAASAFLPQQYAQGQLGLLGQGLGPYGQTVSTPTQSSPLMGLLGAGLSIFGGPAGMLAGAGLNALGSGNTPDFGTSFNNMWGS